MKSLTILDIAVAKGAKKEEGAINGSEFDRLGLPMFGGCMRCEASIAAYNAYPTKAGYLMDRECMDENDGFTTVAEFDLFTERLEAENTYWEVSFVIKVRKEDAAHKLGAAIDEVVKRFDEEGVVLADPPEKKEHNDH